MKLSAILEKAQYSLLQGDIDVDISDIVYDSRKAAAGVVFVCMVGAVVDGHEYVAKALENGAVALVVEREIAEIPAGVTVVKVASARETLAYMSAAFFGYPANELVTVGITGTKGKTTSTYMLKSVLEKTGAKVGLIGTIGITVGDELIPAKNTTPESYELHKYFRMMVNAGCKYAVMEVSSQGLKLSRVAGIEFDIGLFTNLSPDHIGPAEHESFGEYAYCKSLLFRQCKVGVINADDENTEKILSGHTCRVKTYSVNGSADLCAKNVRLWQKEGALGVMFDTVGDAEMAVSLRTPGVFSVYNALGTALTAHLIGVADEDIKAGLAASFVKGRVELVPASKDFTVIIDYAHNEISTRSVLNTLLEYKPKRLICLFGGGGNRSKLRRYDMGEVTGELADLCVITSDNPRDEELHSINEDIKIGLARSNGKYIEIDDREEAIRYCIKNAQKGDMIVLLGKGHQTYEEIRGVKYHFDEREVVAKVANELGLV